MSTFRGEAMTTPAFTKEQLESIVAWDGAMQPCPDLAAFALSLMEERDEAVADATILAHAYTTDSRPPQNIVDRSIRRGKDALNRRWAKESGARTE